MLTGEYAARARKSYKTLEAKKFLAAVREGIVRIDLEMKKPSSPERGGRIAEITSAIEMAADSFDLYGEQGPRRRKKGKVG